MTDDSQAFDARNREMIAAGARDEPLRQATREWFDRASDYEYSYHFSWLGRPIIQFPQDVVALQEVIWRVRPDVVVETGIARGGSLVLSASLLELLGGDRRRVIGIDIDIRDHNRLALETHPLFRRIELIEGSSVDEAVVADVRGRIAEGEVVLVILDSNHTHDHVARELELYAPLVSPGSYLIVFDTVIEQMREDAFADRPWARGDNAATALNAFLERDDRFEVDHEISDKLLITVAPGGYVRRVR